MDTATREKPYNKLIQCSPVNIEFEDLSYSVKGGGECKQILKNINGFFRSGEVSAILGCSGSGKTTLLNILSGCALSGVSGSIKVNGKERQIKHFYKINTYIMQNDCLPPHLTVHEAMVVAADLKLGSGIKTCERQRRVEEILSLLRLETCVYTRVENLSGGEKKRLSIGLEIISNPPVIFLDEPMSGLDNVAIKQCMEVFRILADQGRTVVFTVHQPSTSTFEKFDQVYFIADGMCIYNGSTVNMIPFLSSINLNCPVTYSPAEYVIECAQISQENLSTLANAIQNGKHNKRHYIMPMHLDNYPINIKKEVQFTTSSWKQFCTLYHRMMLQILRNKIAIVSQVISYALVAALFGILFYGVGNNAEFAMENFKYYIFISIGIMHTHMIPPAASFPFEFELLKREYFNRWYGLKPYFFALILRNVPLIIMLQEMLVVITYTLTDQPLEWQRFLKFNLVFLLVAFASEALGLAIGSVCSPTSGAIAGPSIYAPLIFLGVYGMGYGSAVSKSMKVLMHGSFLRLAGEATILATFENRTQFECSDDMLHCFYKNPKHVLRDLGVLGHSYWIEVLGLVLYMMLFQFIAFLALRYRLSTEFAPRIANFLTKILRYK